MLDRLDMGGYILKGMIHWVPRSSAPNDDIAFEVPSAGVDLAASDEVVGRAVVDEAERCKLSENLRGLDSNDVARALGFKSDADLHKKVIPLHVARRKGGDLIVRWMVRQKSHLVFTESAFSAPVTELAEIGQAVKKAASMLGQSS